MSGFLGDIAADIGDSYQDILLQDSPLANDREGLPGPEAGDTFPGMEAAEPMTGDILPPAQDFDISVSDVDALPQTIDADYAPVAEAEPQPAPEPVAEIGYDPQPDMGDDLGPSF